MPSWSCKNDLGYITSKALLWTLQATHLLPTFTVVSLPLCLTRHLIAVSLPRRVIRVKRTPAFYVLECRGPRLSSVNSKQAALTAGTLGWYRMPI